MKEERIGGDKEGGRQVDREMRTRMGVEKKRREIKRREDFPLL